MSYDDRGDSFEALKKGIEEAVSVIKEEMSKESAPRNTEKSDKKLTKNDSKADKVLEKHNKDKQQRSR